MNIGGWIFFVSACGIIIGLVIYTFYKVLTLGNKSKE